jgi:hypothetical protein
MRELIIRVDNSVERGWDGSAKVFETKELVRCKDCKHYHYYGLANDTVSECTMNHCENSNGDWFCADGERK